MQSEMQSEMHSDCQIDRYPSVGRTCMTGLLAGRATTQAFSQRVNQPPSCEKKCESVVNSMYFLIYHRKSWTIYLGSVLVEGLVDASDDTDFKNKLDDMVLSWQHMSIPSLCNLQVFIDWFLANKLHVIRDNMLRPIREECGLGCLPDPFTTNASESINAMLKRKVDYK